MNLSKENLHQVSCLTKRESRGRGEGKCVFEEGSDQLKGQIPTLMRNALNLDRLGMGGQGGGGGGLGVKVPIASHALVSANILL